ncbi:hypothetical protein QBC34DRAFT_402930 [Podospora aff. communis PSN243]|uniref:Uncharacterized protein n=1 Tax=Podospora aff. communis PSN243 TaxID=3040156 RepID=A0AAV9GSR8_9PEZI|nr:hypothetical protein QBC34DRAFT_402930 [Podospora aff. communis PSN243]
MRVSTFISAAICLFSVAEANVSDLTIPAVIRVGVPFVANYTYPMMQPRDAAIIWGVTAPGSQVGEMGGYGHVGVTNIHSDDVVPSDGRNYFMQIQKGLMIPYGTYGQGGPLVIQAAIIGYIGAAGNLFIQTRYWNVNTTLDGESSVEQILDVEELRTSGVWPKNGISGS